jgi:hypothetical protein
MFGSLVRVRVRLALCKAALFVALLSLTAFTAAQSSKTGPVLAALESKADYATAVKALAGADGRGVNARAGYEIAKIYEFCGVFWGPKDKAAWLDLYQKTVASTDPARATRIALAAHRYTQCEALLKESLDLYKERTRWLNLAAEQGDVPAKLTGFQEQVLNDTSRTAFINAVRSALDSDDPVVVWELSRSLRLSGFLWADLSKKPWPGKEIDGLRAVYQLAACELGYPCGAGSTMIEGFCIRGTCSATSYQAWLPSFLDAMQLKVVKAELPRVLKALRKKRGAALIFKS